MARTSEGVGFIGKLWSFVLAFDDLADDEGLARMEQRVRGLEDRIRVLEQRDSKSPNSANQL